MNPEDNNPTTTPTGAGPIDFTGGANGASAGLSMADSMASARDNLTSAGLAANEAMADATMGLNQIGASDPSAAMERPDEPLIPAAPVPGSLGSVVSGPAVKPEAELGVVTEVTTPTAGTPAGESLVAELNNAAAKPASEPALGTAPAGNPATMATPSVPNTATPMGGPATPAEPFTPVDPAVANPSGMPAAAKETPAPAAPFNPFATPTVNKTPELPNVPKDGMTSASGVPAGLQPRKETFSQGKTRGGKATVWTVILAIVAFAAVVAAVVFAVLWRQAVDNPKIVYVAQGPAQDEVQEPTETKVVCTQALETLPEMEGLTAVNNTMNLMFGDDDRLTTMASNSYYSFADAPTAEATREMFNLMVGTMNAITNSIQANFTITEATVDLYAETNVNEAIAEEGVTLSLPQDENGAYLTDKVSVQQHFEGQGFTCQEAKM